MCKGGATVQFEYPNLLWLLLSLPFIYWWLYHRKNRRGQVPINFHGVARLHSPLWNLLVLLTRVTTIIIPAFLILSLAQPTEVAKQEIALGRGLSIVFSIDTSISMGARDIEGLSRIEAIQGAMEKFVLDKRNDEFGLVGFGSQTALLCPLTTDYESFVKAISFLKPGLYGDGTSIGLGIAYAASYLPESKEGPRTLVLLSDGENTDTDFSVEQASTILSKLGVRLYTISVGKNGHSTIEYYTDFGKTLYRGTYESLIDPRVLQSAARLTNGEFFTAQTSDDILRALNAIQNRETTQDLSKTYFKKKPVDDVFVLLTLLIFIFNYGLRKVILREVL